MITKPPMAKEAYETIRDDPEVHLYIPTIVDGSSGVVGRIIRYFYFLIESIYGFACLSIVIFFLDESRLGHHRICHIISARYTTISTITVNFNFILFAFVAQ